MRLITFAAFSTILRGLPSLAEPIPDALAEAEAYAELFIDDPILSERDLFQEDEPLAALQERDEFADAVFTNLYARDLHRRMKNKPNLKINPAEVNSRVPSRFDMRYSHVNSGGSQPGSPSQPKAPPASKQEYSKGMAAHTAQGLKKAQDTGRPLKDPSQYRHGPTQNNHHSDYFNGYGGGQTYQLPGSSAANAGSSSGSFGRYSSIGGSPKRRRALIRRMQDANLIEAF